MLSSGVAYKALAALPADDEVRRDAVDGASFTLSELLALNTVARSSADRRAVEEYWRSDCQPPGDAEECRVDPADGRGYTLVAFAEKYAGQFDRVQCREYFHAVMPRPCHQPAGLVAASASRGGGTCASALVAQAPFAAAARWAAELPEVSACDGDFASCGNPHDVCVAWRYAVANLRLAIGALEPQDVVRHWEPLLGVFRASEALAAFFQRPTPEGFTTAVASARAALTAFGPWLAEQGSAKVELHQEPSVCFPAPLPGALESATAATAKLGGPAGPSIPLLGFGTWQLHGEAAYAATLAALRVGYRHIDTAQLYQNEREVGRAIKDSGVPRKDIFLATKLSDPASFARPRPVVEAQLERLGTDYVDLYMLHQPASSGSVRAVWRELEAMHAEGKIRALGVSNFSLQQLRELLDVAKVPPVYLQNKLSVYAMGEQRISPDTSIMTFARERGIQFFGYSVVNPWPGVLRPMEDPHVLAVAARCARTPAQVLLRWALQLGVGILPKSSSRARVEDNFHLFDFSLSGVDMQLLTGLATLSESAGGRRAPLWLDDTYGLGSADS